MEPKTDIEVQLIGQDGNAFNLVGITANELRRNGHDDYADELWSKLNDCESYDAVLQLIQSYVYVC